VGIALWRQRRLVQAESAEVSLNRKRFGDQQALEVCQILNLEYDVYKNIPAPEYEPKEIDIALLKDERKLWKSLVDEEVADENDPFAHLPEELQRELLDQFEVEAGQPD
jgi:hypothetical protein